MKKCILLILFLIAFFVNGHAQKNIATYTDYYLGGTYDIDVVEDRNDYFLYIQSPSIDDSKGGIYIETYRCVDFVNSIKEAKEKYKEWVKLAKANKVTEFRKTIPVSCVVKACFISNDEWYYQYFVNLIFDISISKNDIGTVDYNFIVKTGTLKSHKDENITTHGFVIGFESEKQVDAFLDKISLQKIEAAKKEIEAAKKENELFK